MMIRALLICLLTCCAYASRAQVHCERDFRDSTLRIDYVFAGTDSTQRIAVDELKSFAGWAGRRVNLDRAPLKGNGEIVMRDAQDGHVTHCAHRSSLTVEQRNRHLRISTRKGE